MQWLITITCCIKREKQKWYKTTGDWNDPEIVSLIIFFLFLPSDGAGRSGVYLAIDANIELSEEDGVIDVFGYVRKMRTQRRGLVESLVSYLFNQMKCPIWLTHLGQVYFWHIYDISKYFIWDNQVYLKIRKFQPWKYDGIVIKNFLVVFIWK